MSNFDPYIFFNGNCEEAMKFYERTLGGKLNLMKAKDSPAAGKTPPGTENKILHSRLDFDGGVLMASDWMDTNPYPGMGGFSVAVNWAVGDKLENIVGALKAKGVVFEHYDMPGITRKGDIHIAGKIMNAWLKDPDGNILSLVSG